MIVRAVKTSLKSIWSISAVKSFDSWLPFIRFVLAAVLVLSGVAARAQGETCEALFDTKPIVTARTMGLELPAHHSILRHDEQDRIREILADETRPDEERWREVLDLYFAARVRLISERLREQVLNKMRKLQFKFSATKHLRGTTKWIEFPNEFRGTPLPYAVAAHEFEHLLRIIVQSNGWEQIDGRLSESFNPVALYHEEGYAMAAEWEIVRLMSDKDADSLVALARQRWSAADRKFIQVIVSARRLSRVDYVAAMRASGRYSPVNSVQKVVVKTANVVAVAGGIGAYLAGLGWGACALFHMVF